MKTLLALGLVIVVVLGGLYLYMNRFDYLKLGSGYHSGTYLRINKLTGYECVMFTGSKEHLEDLKEAEQHGELKKIDVCGK